MPIAFDSLAALLDHGFDTVIDVRSPSEYAEDHIPGAINLPVLSDQERAEVGTVYKQVSAFNARRIGAALVARNAAAHIAGPLAENDGSWRPLVYCWRGGQRSGSFTMILQQVGWRAEVIAGGYQTFRRLVHRALYDDPLPHKVILLDGYTGTAKTDILSRLPARGVQVIDLEGLARHRGSLLGEMASDQPSQRAFETALATALMRLDPARPVVLEAESNKIGQRNIPPALWAPMRAAPRIEVSAPLAARAAYLTQTYADIIADPERLAARLAPLKAHRGAETVGQWLALLDAGEIEQLAARLMQDHYDPSYAKSRAAHAPVTVGSVELPALGPADLDRAADRVADIVRSL
jgi:tRNA 2-selenouridine synthase